MENINGNSLSISFVFIATLLLLYIRKPMLFENINGNGTKANTERFAA